MIQGLIFDFDGLILETESPIYQSWAEVYQSFGCQLPLPEWVKIIGLAAGQHDPFASLEQQLGYPVDRELIRPKRRQRELDLIYGREARPGVREYLAGARRLGLKTGVATSSSCDWVTGHLERLDLLGYIDCVKASNDVANTKPDPELYISVLTSLGLEAGQTVAFEDSPNGIRSAKSAGLFCVVVPNKMTFSLPLDEADLRLDSMADVPLEALLAEVEEKLLNR